MRRSSLLAALALTIGWAASRPASAAAMRPSLGSGARRAGSALAFGITRWMAQNLPHPIGAPDSLYYVELVSFPHGPPAVVAGKLDSPGILHDIDDMDAPENADEARRFPELAHFAKLASAAASDPSRVKVLTDDDIRAVNAYFRLTNKTEVAANDSPDYAREFRQARANHAYFVSFEKACGSRPTSFPFLDAESLIPPHSAGASCADGYGGVSDATAAMLRWLEEIVSSGGRETLAERESWAGPAERWKYGGKNHASE